MVRRFIPIPGDLILVETSEWYALKDGEKLRVCEPGGWIEEGEELLIAPRHQVTTFWGPQFGPPVPYLPMTMSTSGGPFKTVKIRDLLGLQLLSEEEDTFWHWADVPRAGGNIERQKKVALWSLPLLQDNHFRELQEYGLPTHRDRTASDTLPDATDADESLPWED